MAEAAVAAQTNHARTRAGSAARDALFAGLITAGLCFPIVALRAEPDIRNRLELNPRWSWLVTAVLIVASARFLAAMLDDWRARAIALIGLLLAAFGIGSIYFASAVGPAIITGTIITGAIAIVAAFAIQSKSSPADSSVPSKPSLAARFADSRFANWGAVFGIGLLVAFPLVMLGWLGPAGSLKWVNNYGIQILIFIMLGWGLNIVVGLAGLLDLGYVAFYAVGAYSYALLATTFGLSFWICLPLAGILAAFWGILLGIPVLRLRGDYLALVTLAFGEIIYLVLLNWVDLTNGEAGISSIPRVTFFGIPFVNDTNGFANLFGLTFTPIHRTIFLFYVILFLALLTNFATLRLRRLPIGRAWEALREDEVACRSLGINTVNTKLTAFALGAMFGGFAGSFFAVRQGFVSPNSFTFIESATILSIVVLGGMGSQIGVALAAIVMIGGTEILRELEFLKQLFGPSFDPTQYRMLIFGLAMVVMMIWRPRGFISTRTPSIFLKERKSVSSEFVGQGERLMRWQTDPLLHVEHLTMRFGGLVAIDDLSFTAGRGDITALIGPNGAGKTTVFNCITGFYKPTEGRLAFARTGLAEDSAVEALTNTGLRHKTGSSGDIFLLERMPDFEIAAKAKVARTFQNIRLFAGMTVLENLIVAQHNPLMQASGWTLLALLGVGPYRNREKRAVESARVWLDRIGLTDRADDPAGDLPYGDQRRLEIARAMCTGPELLCLDEPAAGLNPRETGELNALLRLIRDECSTSLLLIEHDMAVVMEISDHVVVIDYGVKISDGTPDHVRNDPKVIAAYLGVEDEEVDEVEAAIGGQP